MRSDEPPITCDKCRTEFYVRTNFERHSCGVTATRSAIRTDAGISRAEHDPCRRGEVLE